MINVLGIDPNIIKLHPDDVDEDIVEEATNLYSAKLLGSFIGLKAFVTEKLLIYVQNVMPC